MNVLLAVIISATTAVTDKAHTESAVTAHQQVHIDALELLHIEFGQTSARPQRSSGVRNAGRRVVRQSTLSPRAMRVSRPGAAAGISPDQLLPISRTGSGASPRYSTGVGKKAAQTGKKQPNKPTKRPFQPPEPLGRWNYILRAP